MTGRGRKKHSLVLRGGHVSGTPRPSSFTPSPSPSPSPSPTPIPTPTPTPTPPSVLASPDGATHTPLLSSQSPLTTPHSTSPIADESSHHVDEETLQRAFDDPPSPPTSRHILVPSGSKEYVPSTSGTNAVTSVLKRRLTEVYHSWKEVPVPIQESWFEDWKKFVTFDPEHEGHMYTAFLFRCGLRMKGLYYDIRIAQRKPKWMLDNVYVGLRTYWGTDGFKGLSNRNKKNRESGAGMPVYAGGSVSVNTRIMNKEAETGTKMRVDDIFRDAFVKKADRDKPIEELPEGKTKDDLVEFKRLKAEQEQRHLEDPTYPLKSDDDLWAQMQGGRNSKGRLLGLNHKRKASVVTDLAHTTALMATQQSEIKELKEMQKQMSIEHKQGQEQMMHMMQNMMKMIEQGAKGDKGKSKVVEN